MKIGYARVSTTHQDLEAQRQALIDAGVKPQHIYQDQMSGSRDDRPQLRECLRSLRSGDTLVVPTLDRLGRSLPHLVKTAQELRERGLELVSLRERIDTTGATGKLVFNIFASLAEFERELIAERTRNGLAARKAQGVSLGAPRKLGRKELRRAQKLLKSGELSAREVARQFGISKATLFRYFPGGRSAL